MDRTGPIFEGFADPGDSAVVDYHLARLETYLDGELDPAEAAKVREEVASDPTMAAAVGRLSAARRLRVDCVEAPHAGDDEAVERLCREARKLATRAAVEAPATAGGRSIWWYGSAAAACAAFGFGLLLGGYDFGVAPADPLGNPVPAENNGMLVSDEGGVDRTTIREQDTTDLLLEEARPDGR